MPCVGNSVDPQNANTQQRCQVTHVSDLWLVLKDFHSFIKIIAALNIPVIHSTVYIAKEVCLFYMIAFSFCKAGICGIHLRC